MGAAFMLEEEVGTPKRGVPVLRQKAGRRVESRWLCTKATVAKGAAECRKLEG